MANWPSTNRVVLVSSIACLILLEVGLLEGLLPYEWRHAIHQTTERVFPSPKYDPDPDLDWEFELDFRQHPAHRVEMFGIVGVLVSGVAYLIMRTWRELHKYENVCHPWEAKKSYRCPCCHYKTLHGRGHNELCKVCFWEDDGQDDHDAGDVRGGPNRALSLKQARLNFLAFGAYDRKCVRSVRPPLPDEL